jgi:hypothetical protein
MHIILIFCIIITVHDHTHAQHPQTQLPAYKGSFSLAGTITLDSLTKFVHQRSGVRFSFNSSKVKGSKLIAFPRSAYSLQAILQHIRKTTSLYYSYYAGYIVFQDNPPRQQQPALHTKKTIAPKKKDAKNDERISLTAHGNIKKNKQTTAKLSKPGKPVEKQKPTPQPTLRDTNPPAVSIKTNNDPAALPLEVTDAGKKDTTEKSITPTQPGNDIRAADTVKFIPSDTISAATAINNPPIVRPVNRSRTNKEKKDRGIHYGLQWNINLPLFGFSNYAIGTDGKSQPYNPLIPGIWISKMVGSKSELLLLVKPAQQYLTSGDLIAVSTVPRSVLDTQLIRQTTTVLKTSSIYTGLHYQYRFNDRWSIGAGMNYHIQSGALMNKRRTNLSNGIIELDSLYSIKRSSADWQNLQSSFFTGQLSVLYQFSKFQAGATLFIPLTKFYTAPVNDVRHVNGHIFLRWRIR